MVEYLSESSCKELKSKYYRLVSLIELVIGYKHEIRKLKNHSINNFPVLINSELTYWWEAKGMQSILLKDVYVLLNDFKKTRNRKLKQILNEIEYLADEIRSYD